MRTFFSEKGHFPQKGTNHPKKGKKEKKDISDPCDISQPEFHLVFLLVFFSRTVTVSLALILIHRRSSKVLLVPYASVFRKIYPFRFKQQHPSTRIAYLDYSVKKQTLDDEKRCFECVKHSMEYFFEIQKHVIKVVI